MEKTKNSLKKFFSFAGKKTVISSFLFLLVMPASPNYKLKDFGFGSGGTDSSSAGGFSMEAITGEVSGAPMSGGGIELGAGLIFTNQANVPLAPTFTNPSNYYNKLKLVINQSGNPDDAKFAIAISTDNFVSDTRYIQSDDTVGAVLGSEDYQLYADWGGVGGSLVIGLSPGTEYKVKAKAMQGNFTETDYGPVATASTINPTLTFDIDVSADGSETGAPFAINLGDLTAGSVVDSTEKIWVDISTNGELGAKVYVQGTNAGLFSSTAGHLIDAVSGDLASGAITKGFGAQGSSVAETSGGPLAIAALYDQTADNVGITDQSIREIFTSALPIVGGRGSFVLKAKSSTITPAAADYSEILTVIASGRF